MICHLVQVASLFKPISTLWLKCGVQQTNAPFWEVICVPRISIWYLPTHPSQTHKLSNIKLIDSTFMYFCWGGSTAINANIRLARCFIVMLPSARIDRNGYALFTLCTVGPSQMAPVLEPLPIYLLFENRGRGAATGLNAADGYLSVHRWLSKYANTFR